MHIHSVRLVNSLHPLQTFNLHALHVVPRFKIRPKSRRQRAQDRLESNGGTERLSELTPAFRFFKFCSSVRKNLFARLFQCA